MTTATARARADELRREAESILEAARRQDRLDALAKLPSGWEERAAAEFIESLRRGDECHQIKFGDGLWISFAAGAICLHD
jgi:hypothetical protein